MKSGHTSDGKTSGDSPFSLIPYLRHLTPTPSLTPYTIRTKIRSYYTPCYQSIAMLHRSLGTLLFLHRLCGLHSAHAVCTCSSAAARSLQYAYNFTFKISAAGWLVSVYIYDLNLSLQHPPFLIQLRSQASLTLYLHFWLTFLFYQTLGQTVGKYSRLSFLIWWKSR